MKALPDSSPALIYLPAAWSEAGDLIAWRTEDGREESGPIAELPALSAPVLVLGWPSVAWLGADVPPAVAGQPRALASALEESLLQEPEDVFALEAGRDVGRAWCVVTGRNRLRRFLEVLGQRGVIPERAVPEAGWGEPGSVVVHERAGWACAADGLPVLLDEVDHGDVPVVLRHLVRGAAMSRLVVHRSDKGAKPDLSAWSARLGCPVSAGMPWHWSRAALENRPDLLCHEFRLRSSLGRRLQPWLRPLFVAVVSLFLLELGMSVLDWGRLTWRAGRLQEQMVEAYRAAVPGNAPLLAPMLQARRALGDLRRSRGQWGEDDFVPLATRALPVLSLLPAGSLKSVVLENRQLVVEAGGLTPLAGKLQAAAVQAGLTARLRPDARLVISSGDSE